MRDNPTAIITRLLGNRKTLLELVVVAVLLAFAVNMISSAILDLGWISPLTAFILASLLALASTAYFGGRLFWFHTHTHRFRGFIIHKRDSNRIIDVPRYDYGSSLHSYLQAAFAENAAIKRMWEQEPISRDFHHSDGVSGVSDATCKGYRLIAEATEYYVLERLSTHLTDYFNRPGFDKRRLHTFVRNDIPDVLLSNRFLELFSKPMEDRVLFSSEPDGVYHEGEVVMSIGEGGAFYSRFDLTLPVGACARRDESDTIIIDTDRFTLSIHVDFRGFGTIVPWAYQKHILGVDPMECRDYQVGVQFRISFKFASLLLPSGWEYYRWIESFMKSFDRKFSEDRFFKDIGWEFALTLIEYYENKASNREGKPPQPDTGGTAESDAAPSSSGH